MVKRLFALAAVCLLGMSVVACAPQGSQPSAEIPALSDQWEEALNAGDIDALVAMYTEDCRILAPNAELGEGHGAAEEAFGELIDSGLKVDLETLEARVAGDLGYHVGRYTLESPDGAVVDRGKFIETRRRVNGEWQISNDIWNSDLPAGAGETTLIVTHEVEDAEHWLAAWQGPDSRHDLFAQHGAPSVRVFQSPEDTNLTGLLVQVADMDAFQAMLASQEGEAAKAEDGVKDATIRMLTEVK